MLLVVFLFDCWLARLSVTRSGGLGRVLYYTMLYYTTLYYTILYYAMLCYAIQCYAIQCYAMLCYATLCYSLLQIWSAPPSAPEGALAAARRLSRKLADT